MSARRPSARPSPRREDGRPELTASGLRVGGRTLPIFCGSVQYFRLAREHWRIALEAVRELGLELIETYVPWGVHERPDGTYDFGEGDPRLDLCAFLDLAAELELQVFVRPGPHVNAELPLFGLPPRVVFDPPNQARSPRGNPLPLPAPPRFFPVPSYASESFKRETSAWYRTVGDRIADRCWPDGPVVLLQVDNEAAYYFRDGPYDADYHPDAIAGYRRFVEARHGTIEALNQSWGSAHASFGDVDAPRKARVPDRAALPERLDWADYQEALLGDALRSMRDELAQYGFEGLPTVHNLPMGDAGLASSLSSLRNSVDLVGLDYYHGRDGLEQVRRKTQRLAGNTRHPFAPELGVGAPPWFGPRPDKDALFSAMCACAFGLRAFNLYMTVDRDRWYGAPIAPDGTLRRSAERWKRFIEALRSSEHHRLTRRVQVAISVPREYARLTRATHTLGALSPSALHVAGLPASSACSTRRFGFGEAIQIAWTKLLWRLDRALCEQQIPFVYVEDVPDPKAHPELKLLFAPTYEFASPERIDALREFEASGGCVIWGPEEPRLDARLREVELPRPGRRDPMQLTDQPTAEQLVDTVANELELERPYPVLPRPVLSAVHRDEAGPRLVFLVNPGAADVRAEVQLPAAMAASDAMNGERFEGGSWRVPMAARSCRMLVLEREAATGIKRKPRGPSARARRGS